MVIGRTETLRQRAIGLFDRVGARIYPNAQKIGAQIALGHMQTATPIVSPIRPDQIVKANLPTMLAMEAAPAAPAATGIATGSGPAPQTVVMRRKQSFLTSFVQNRVGNFLMKAVGAGTVLYALPFAPVTAAGFYYFTLPLTAAGLGLIYASLGKPLQTRIASALREMRQANAALPKVVRASLYISEGASVLFSLKNFAGFATLLMAGLAHTIMLFTARAEKARANAPLDIRLANAKDVPALAKLVASLTPNNLPKDPDSLQLISLELQKQLVYLRQMQGTEPLQNSIGQVLDYIDLAMAPSPAAPGS